ncbi:MAG: hypothetical protein NZL96_00405 [Patescibacteria group bacterium]|nr:hypothetical protein [Patescibacteria group bacterium]
MKDYQVTLKALSPLTSVFSADTFNGWILYSLSLRNKELFVYLLEKFKNDNPPFAFSSLLPCDYLPINSNFLTEKLGENDQKNNQSINKDLRKKLKKIRYLPIEFFSNLPSKTPADFLALTKKDDLLSAILRFHNNIDQKLLFFVEGLAPKTRLSLYLRVREDDQAILEEIFRSLDEGVEFFLGKKKSVGYNQLKILNVQATRKLSSQGDHFIATSHFNPHPQEKEAYEPLFFDLKIKHPKIGDIYAQKNPFKRKIVLVEEGAVFRSKKNKEIIGKVINQVSYRCPEFVQITVTIPFYFQYA